jgi:predicted transcriptional regulator
MDVMTVRLDQKTRKELDEVAAELGESASEVISKAIHLAWFAAVQDKLRRESARSPATPQSVRRQNGSESGPDTLLRKGSIF